MPMQVRGAMCRVLLRSWKCVGLDFVALLATKTNPIPFSGSSEQAVIVHSWVCSVLICLSCLIHYMYKYTQHKCIRSRKLGCLVSWARWAQQSSGRVVLSFEWSSRRWGPRSPCPHPSEPGDRSPHQHDQSQKFTMVQSNRAKCKVPLGVAGST